MNVSQCVDIYIERKQRSGYVFNDPAIFLRRFALFTGKMNIAGVRDDHLNAFLSRRPKSNNTWRRNSSTLTGFFRYWLARGQLRWVPMALRKPAVAETSYPYVYSREEIHRLLAASTVCQRTPRCSVSAETLKTILLFLYGTAVRLREALSLRVSEIDFENDSLRLHDTSIYLRREISMGPDIKRLLSQYLNNSERCSFGRQTSLFLDKNGRPVQPAYMGQTFFRLRRIAGIKCSGRFFQPRLQDLRHTFAVHSIEKWTREGRNIDKMLPMLATFMGNVRTFGLKRYLEVSPCRYATQLARLETRVTPGPGQKTEARRFRSSETA